jgi:hypothetical protein
LQLPRSYRVEVTVVQFLAMPDFGRFPLTRLTGLITHVLRQTGLVSAANGSFDRPHGRTLPSTTRGQSKGQQRLKDIGTTPAEAGRTAQRVKERRRSIQPEGIRFLPQQPRPPLSPVCSHCTRHPAAVKPLRALTATRDPPVAAVAGDCRRRSRLQAKQHKRVWELTSMRDGRDSVHPRSGSSSRSGGRLRLERSAIV